MKDLTQELVQFKQLTIELIGALQQDEVYKLDSLLDCRQVVIENMEKLQYTTKEFTDICNEFDILNFQKKLSELIQQKRDDTKQELNKIRLTKSANSNYNKNFYDNVEIFNKKI